MPTLSSPGVGSGLDVNNIVTQLVAAERDPIVQRLTRQQSKIDTQVSALGALKGAMSTLQSSLSAIKSVAAFQTRKATSSNTDEFSATATNSAAAGTYSIEITSLASAHKLSSNAFASGPTSVVGTGTLTISVGTQHFDVEIDATKSTLAGIRDAINNSANNKGAQATIVQATDGARLVLTARNTGLSNALRVTTVGGDGGLAPLVYDPGTATNLIEKQAAQDAVLSIEGFAVHSASNTVTDAIDGVTLNLVGAAPGSTQALVVTNDVSASQDRVKKFVSDYNILAAVMGDLRKFNPATREAGPLLGDSLLRSVEGSVKNGLTSPVSNAAVGFDTLASIGITTSSTGTLSINDAKLSAALSSNFDAVGQLLGGTDGIAARLHSRIDSYLGAKAQLTARTDGLEARKRTLTKEMDVVDRRMQDVERRYRKQFTSLDSLLAGMQSTSAYLSKQLK